MNDIVMKKIDMKEHVTFLSNCKSVIFFLLILLMSWSVFFTFVSAETPPLNQEWVMQYYDQSNNIGIYPTNVVVDSSGNIIVAGYGNERVGEDEGYSYIVIIKCDTNGNQLWVKRYDTTYGDGTPTFLAVDKSDNIYLTAYSVRNGNSNSATLKYDSNGNQLWVATYDIVYLSSLVVDNSGNVYGTGSANDGSGTFVTIKYDSVGNQLWVKEHSINAAGPPLGIRVDSSGYVYVTGTGDRYESVGGGIMISYTETIKYDTDGNQIWVAKYDNNMNDATPYSLTSDNSGNVYVTGTSLDSENRYGFSTIKYDSDGNQLWVARFDDVRDSEVVGGSVSLTLDSSGHVYVTASIFNYENYHDEELTIKYDTDGNQLWVAKKDCIDYASFPFPLLAVDTSGNIYLSGCSCTALKYSPNNTPTGNNISIPLSSGTITFSTVISKGDTTVITTNAGPIPPTGFQMGEHPIYYEIMTTATFIGPISVCLSYDDTVLTQSEENNLVLLHHRDDTQTWENITSSRDPINNVVCGITDSFSIFVVALPVNTITFRSPNGGEIIPSGSTHSIQWVAPSNAVKFDLKYSMNNGLAWKSITSKVTGTNYNWTVPTPANNKKNCLVKVIGYNASGVKVGEDTSDSTFTIEVLKVTAPNGGETTKSNEVFFIRWDTNATKKPVANTYLYYSLNGGSTWKLLAVSTDHLGWYAWQVPKVTSAKTNCKVKVVLKDANGNIVAKDVSDGVFTIQP